MGCLGRLSEALRFPEFGRTVSGESLRYMLDGFLERYLRSTFRTFVHLQGVSVSRIELPVWYE